ncbi:YcdB/YcdC domain-containing protein [Psychrobacillus sp. FSL K6-4046]|uniref:YcdB/YcdC domain-containing protein n=1 Tax=Psychrobacillus sp. FSL K6-4046 TaxID=2921550 RepID=UPI00315AC7FC
MGIILTASALSLGMLSATANASNTTGTQPYNVVAQVAATDVLVSKEELLKKFKASFPGVFDSIKPSEFYMHSYDNPYENTTRHSMSFHKQEKGKEISGSIGFYGDNYEIESFQYEPVATADSLFPGKVSKDGAKQIAHDFMKKYMKDGSYQLEEGLEDFYYSSQILTRPIRYTFSFNRMQDGVAVGDQQVNVTVLGNGEVVGFNRAIPSKSSTFDDVKKGKDAEVILNQIKDNLTAKLQYQITYPNEGNKPDVKLVYKPEILSVNAITGDWFNSYEFLKEYPAHKGSEMIVEKALPVKHNGITKEAAKKTAENLLKVDSSKIKLTIQSVEEMKNYNGQEVISVHYMYHFSNGSGSGSSIEFDKKTGELVRFHSMQQEIKEMLDENKDPKSLSYEEALAKAVEYAKEYLPSYLHEYALPSETSYADPMSGYYFIFPRIVDGVLVVGDQINVNIHKDGSLSSISIDRPLIDEWPSKDKVISEKEATETFKKSVMLKTSYMKEYMKRENNHYYLISSPLFNEEEFQVLEASTGKWFNQYNREVLPEVSHPTAAAELNYLIQSKVLTVKDAKSFNGDAAVSKGEAIRIMMNSLTYMYHGYPMDDSENAKQTFTNIDSKHTSYQAVERAVELGVIAADKSTFDVDSPITKEELSIWYIRALGLEEAAKQTKIYKNDFADSKKIKDEYTGYIVLADSLGLLKAEKNQFNPTKQVTYAELAVSTIRLGHEMSKKGRDYRYGY